MSDETKPKWPDLFGIDPDFAPTPQLVIENGWLCEVRDGHTCGTGPDGYYGQHEPGCGLVPIANVGHLLAEERARALREAATDAKVRGDIGRDGQIEVWDWLNIRADREQP